MSSIRYDRVKRLLDVAVVVLSAPIWLPVLALVSVSTRIAMGTPVFFRQKRPGLGGKIFELVKFRTMRDGPGDDSERLTRYGRFLRSSSLDELPQLLNVLKGEMSVVGPRPLLVDYLPLYSDEQARRHEVRPGITGWAQVNGRNLISWEDKFIFDVWYVDHRSFRLDFKIIAMTIRSVLVGKGIEASGGGTVKPFTGA